MGKLKFKPRTPYITYGRMIYVGPWLFRGGKNIRPQDFHDPREILYGCMMWALSEGVCQSVGMSCLTPADCLAALSHGQLELIPTLPLNFNCWVFLHTHAFPEIFKAFLL